MARSSVGYSPFTIWEESLWLNALNIDEPTDVVTRRSSLEWLDLAAAEDIISSARELLDAAESLICFPKELPAEVYTTVLERSSLDDAYGAEKHTDYLQKQTAFENESRWGDTIHLDAAFGGSPTDLEEDFPNSNEDNHLRYQANRQNKSQWGDKIDLDAAFGGSATDLEEDFPNPKEDDHPQRQVNSQDKSKWGDVIDLDAAFRESATDLEEEFENVTSQSAAVYVAKAPPREGDASFESPNHRHHIPDDIKERVNHICQTRFLDGHRQVVAGGWSLAKACAQWEYMSKAARKNRRLGLFKTQGKIPQEVNRSCATTWENEEWPIGKPSTRPLAKLDETDPEQCHHVNFLGNPCLTRSNTPPEVSMWVVVTSSSRGDHETLSRKGVITAQANKLIDPFEYDSTNSDLRGLAGSELKNAFIGKVRKVYLDCGTWVDDSYSAKDHIPVPLSYESMMEKMIYCKGNYWHYSLQEPHLINNLYDLDDLVVNKGEIVPPKRHYREPKQCFLSGPSKLCVMELAEDEELDAMLK